MKTEKLAVIGLVIIIAGVLSAYLIMTYGDEIFDNLTGSTETIEIGDCADVHYIGRYASNGTVFDSSYAYVENKTGGTPLKILVSTNKTAEPPEEYMFYASSILMMGEGWIEYASSPLAMIDGFIEELVGMKEGETKTTDILEPEQAFGVSIKVGDKLNLTSYMGRIFELIVIEVQENAPMPSDYIEFFGNGTTSLFMFKEDWHNVGDIVDTDYSFWANSTEIARLNETTLWKYTTPSTSIGENFTWAEIDDMEVQTIYPENTSIIINITDDVIIVTHTPAVNDSIEVVYGAYGSSYYTVENVTDDKINASYPIDEEGNKSYVEFNRTVTIQRNQTQNINVPLAIYGLTDPYIPGELAESLSLSLRLDPYDSGNTFIGSYNSLTGEQVYFELEIVKLYKTSQQES